MRRMRVQILMRGIAKNRSSTRRHTTGKVPCSEAPSVARKWLR
jgi:hypothetical protein